MLGLSRKEAAFEFAKLILTDQLLRALNLL